MRYFRSSVIDLQVNDQLYLFTDGYADQFGGDRQKKFGYKRMREFFSEIRMKTDEEKAQLIRDAWMQWKSDLEQVDDVLLLHLRV